MNQRPANADMIEGFLDGYDLNCPEPSENRSLSYKHGFANGRDDITHNPRASAEWLREEADRVMDIDEGILHP